MPIYDIDFDDNLVTFAPLGNRFVNHIWRLLTQLNIRFITLLDFDLGRNGGGWGRIKYVINQLIEAKLASADEILLRKDDTVITLEELEEMHKWDYDKDEIKYWRKKLRRYNVFYSAELDLDFLLLQRFPDEYKALAPKPGGPRIPNKTTKEDEYEARIKAAITATLKSDKATGENYNEDQHELMIWYSHLFIGRGKPVTHMKVLSDLSDEDLRNNIPQVLEWIFLRILHIINPTSVA
jgi:hypothetical protein